MPKNAPDTALLRSASANTMLGDLPPSSRLTRFRLLSADARAMRLPTSVEPVKAILSTSGCAASLAPASSPRPGRMLSTPSGSSASCSSSASRSALSGVSSDGLRTTLLPHASAGAIFHAAIKSGKFHGMICPTTPTGSRDTVKRTARRGHGAVHVFSACLCHPGQHLPRGGIQRLECLAAGGLDPPAADKELLRLRPQERRHLKVFGDRHGSIVLVS